MLVTEHWEFRPEWLDWVRSVWVSDKGRVQQQYPKGSPRQAERRAFADRATRAFLSRGIPVRWLKTWVSVQVPEIGNDWPHGYPHVHYPLNGTTLVHYLDPGDQPAPLVLFDDAGEHEVEEILPERGLTVLMPNARWHGVRKNHGTTDRVQLIATALRS